MTRIAIALLLLLAACSPHPSRCGELLRESWLAVLSPIGFYPATEYVQQC